MDSERAAKIAAKRIGVSVDEYRERRASGEKWCSGCKVWHALDAFGADLYRSDGLMRQCREAARAYMREYLKQQTCVDCGEACAGFQRCAGCHSARATRRAEDREAGLPYKRLARAVAVAAKAERDAAVAVRRFFGGIARLAAKLERERLRAMQRAATKAARERKRSLKAARWWNDQRRRPDYAVVSLDAPVDSHSAHSESSPLTRGDLVAVPGADHEMTQQERAELLRSLVGDMDADDVLRMREHDLQRLQDRLRDAGLTPTGIQQAERERLRDPLRKSGHAKAPLIPGKKTRRQKVEHKQANRNRGNSNRPSQKPRKRWEREAG